MEIVWTDPAVRDLRRIDHQTAVRIRAALRRYASTQYGDVRKLEGMDGHFRLRVGDYRVIFRPDSDKLIIIVLRVRHRRDAYRN